MKVDQPRDRSDELHATSKVRFLDVPAHRFAMVDGQGPAGGPAFEERLPGLYAAAYKLRFALKAAGAESRVGPLEGL